MKVAIIGGGPAGLMCAGSISPEHSVTIFEKNEKVGKKLYITGKGRCNVTNMLQPKEFLENVVTNNKFLYSAIFSFSPHDTFDLIQQYGTSLKIERGNRVFPISDKASDITKALTKYAIKNGNVRICYNNIVDISYNNITNDFNIVMNDGDSQRFDKVVIATGGKSYPQTGSTGDGYIFAKKLGHNITQLKPALVPIILNENVKSLQGLSLKNVRASITNGKNTYSEFGEMLFTSNGVSGPIILTLSSLINKIDIKNLKLSIDLKPALDKKTLDNRILSDFKKYSNKELKNGMKDLLPKSLIPYIISYTGINEDKPINIITKEEREQIVNAMKNLEFSISSLASIDLAIVTSGGVNVNEVNPKTMESKIINGLYFAGEVLDVDGYTGGFNIQIALSTGYLAGNNI